MAAAWATVSRSTKPASSKATSPDRFSTSTLGSSSVELRQQQRPGDALVEDVQREVAGAAELGARLGLGRGELVDPRAGNDERDDEDGVLAERRVDRDAGSRWARATGALRRGSSAGFGFAAPASASRAPAAALAGFALGPGLAGLTLAVVVGFGVTAVCGTIGAALVSDALGPSMRMASMPAAPRGRSRSRRSERAG